MRAVATRRRLRAYAYTLVTTAIVLVFAFAEWWASRYVSGHSRVASTAIEVAVVLLAAVAFRPLHHRIETLVEGAFTRRRREAIDTVTRLGRELTSFNESGQLLRRAIEALEEHLHAGGCAVYVRRDTYRAEASSFDEPAESIDLDDPLAVRLRSSGGPAQPARLRSAACGTIAFPMTVAGELVGFVCVGAKQEDYEPEELTACTAFAEALGVALVALDPELRSQSPDVPNNLPADLPPLIGRIEESTEIKALLGRARLVTLTGAGGVGKTRTALYVAAEMRHNDDGLWFVDLAPIVDPALVPSAIAHVFNVPDEGGAQRLIERVAIAIKNKHLLIVLDNCEHVIAVAAESVEYLLQHCPRLQVLATSREPLGLPVEEPYRMPSLPVPPKDETLTAAQAYDYAAVALCVARARTADHDFELTDDNATVIAEIVRRLDGIPMAIELAAPRIKVLTPRQLLDRLDQRFKLLSGGSRTALPRHQTLYALIGWSYDLLAEPERRVLRYASVFRGEWTLEALEAVCAGDWLDDRDPIDLLEALSDKSLIAVQTEGEARRYRLLESTRQFASERLHESGEWPAVALRHGTYYAAAAQRASDEYWITDSDAWARDVREDLENYRAAIAWGLSGEGDVTVGAAVVANLRWFWYTTARREGHALLERAVNACGGSAPSSLRGLLALTSALLDTTPKALSAASEAATALSGVDAFAQTEAIVFEGVALGRAGHVDRSRERLHEALNDARSTHTPRLIGWVLSMAAYWSGAGGDRLQARELFDEAAVVLRSCGDPWQLARLQLHRAEFLFTEGDLADALASVREAASVFRMRGADTGVCVCVLNEAAYLLALGRFDEAWESSREGLALALRLDNAMAITWAIGHLAELAAELGDTALAARLLGRADCVYRETGGVREPTEQRGYDRALELIRINLAQEHVFALMLEGAEMDAQSAAAQAMAIPRPRIPSNV